MQSNIAILIILNFLLYQKLIGHELDQITIQYQLNYFLFVALDSFHFACISGDLDEVKSNLNTLRNEGKDINTKNYDGDTCLDLASTKRHVNVTQFLLANGANCMCNSEGSVGNSCNNHGQCSCKKEFHGRQCGE